MTFGQLIRQAYFPFGTYGTLEVEGMRFSTCECPWLDNKKFVSCIPEGSYEVFRHSSKKFGECFILVGDGVQIEKSEVFRDGVLVHSANWPDQLNGCISVGFGLCPIPIGGRDWPRSLGVTRSRDAMKKLLNLPDHWHLEISSIKAA